MLNETKLKTKQLTKLPRLTIQQQIDNQQVIERMNRKITFTKNPRHLNNTLKYTEAISKQSEQILFKANPTQLIFTSYQAHHTYQAEIKLINNSQYIQRIKLTPLSKKQFVIANVKYPTNNCGDIAPGLHASVFIRFRPISLHDYQDELIVIVGDGVLKIPITAKKQKWNVEFPKDIQCGHCWVGGHTSNNIELSNKGGQAVFTIVGSNNSNLLNVGPFTISPTQFKLCKLMPIFINIDFDPKKAGIFKNTIQIVSDQGQQSQIFINLHGQAHSAQLQLQQLNGQKIKEQKIDNYLYLNDCQIGITKQSIIQIKNLAVVPVNYFWVSEHQSILISQKNGSMLPASTPSFTVSYTPQQRQPIQTNLTLYLYNLPEQSLLNNAISKYIFGMKVIQCLKFQVNTSSKQSQLIVTPLHQQILQKIYLNNVVSVFITIKNNSQSLRKYKIDKIKDDNNCVSEINDIEGQLESNCQRKIQIKYKIIQLNQNLCFCYYLLKFDNSQSQIISVSGSVIYPSVTISHNQVYYGLCRTYTSMTKRIIIENKQLNSVQIWLQNLYKYYQLDYYDLYEFENQEYFIKKLQIITQYSTKQQSQKWIKIPSQSKCWVDFIYHTKEPQQICFQILLHIKDSYSQAVPITVKAFVQNINLSLNNTKINLKQIYQGNVYNSNKFLKKQLTVTNNGNLDASFVIKYQPNPMCSVNIQPLSGIVQKHSKQRIDLILEPHKTGQYQFQGIFEYYDNVQLTDSLSNQNEQNKIIEQVQVSKKLLNSQNILKINALIKGIQINYYLKDQTRSKKVRQKVIDDTSNSIKLSTVSAKSGTKNFIEADKIIYPNLQEIQFYNCEINQVKQIEIIIENASGLTAEYQIYAENYHTLQKEIPSIKKPIKSLINTQQIAFNSDMGRTFIKSRQLANSQKIHLSNNKGISIMCQPSNGTLYKKQQQKIILTMFNDTSGRFKDRLIISVKDHEIKYFPIDIFIKGTPVSLSRNQIGIKFPQNVQGIPIMNLGTFLINNGVAKRNIKIINNGPKLVQIQWLVYPYNKEEENKEYFQLEFTDPIPGSNDIVDIKLHPIKPTIDKEAPFLIEPQVKVLSGRQQCNYTLTIKQFNQIGHFNNLLIGQPTLISENGTKLKMDCLSVILKGQCIKPLLIMDRKHQNHINKFQKFAIQGLQSQTNSKNYHRKIKLKNISPINIPFTITVSNQNLFNIISTSSNTSLSSTSKLTGIYQIQRSFLLSHQSYVQIGIDLQANAKDLVQWPLEQKVRKQGKLIIEYSNSDKQTIDLVGWLYRPWIQIIMPNQQIYSPQNYQIDFGMVHIKNHKKLTIYISNISKVIVKWNISYLKYHQSIKYKFQQALWTNLDKQDQTIKDQKKCFKLSQDSGTILAQSIPVHYMPGTLALPSNNDNYANTHRPDKIDIVFKPQSNSLFKSKFRVTVEQGPYFDIVVKGRGTYQEQCEK